MTWDTPRLTAGIRAGDEAAFDAFYACYGERMRRYLLVVARGDEGAAQEAHQEALLRVVRHVKPMTDDTELWRYLTVVMRTAWIDVLRTGRHRDPRHRPLDPGAAAAGPGDEAVDDRLQQALDRSLERLPERDRRLLMDHYVAGHPQADLALGLGVPLKTLAMRLVRLRRRLRTSIMEALGHG